MNDQPSTTPPGSLQQPGSATVTYAQMQAALKSCRHIIESAPGEDPPDGYETLTPEQAEIADACWQRGMEQMETQILNWLYDTLRVPETKSSNDQAERQEERRQ